MSNLIDVGNAYNTLTEYYGHKTDIQHTALADANHPEIPDSWIPVTKKMPEDDGVQRRF